MRQRHCLVCKKTSPELKRAQEVCDKCLSITRPCPAHKGKCGYVFYKYTQVGKLRTQPEPHHAPDETTPFGSIIHWSQADIEYTDPYNRYVPVTCGYCKQTFKDRVSRVTFRKGTYSGCHKECWVILLPTVKEGFGRIVGKTHGYVQRHVKTFSEEEAKILGPMLQAKRHILEHRAVMALHLGRPLEKDEIVHHLDSNRSNNDLSNLRLLKSNRHHRGHGDDYYQPYQEALAQLRFLLPLVSR